MKNIGFFLITSLLFLGCTTQTSAPTPTPSTESLETYSNTSNDITLEYNEPVPTTNPTNNNQLESSMVTLSTSKGDIVLELFADKAPKTVQNFLSKVDSGFYENLTFHRVEDWVVQGGDPQGTGRGGGQMATELNSEPFITGSLGVARGGNIEVSNDAQFFICTKDCEWLTGQYTNFGKVVEGMDVVNSIAIGDTITKLTPAQP